MPPSCKDGTRKERAEKPPYFPKTRGHKFPLYRAETRCGSGKWGVHREELGSHVRKACDFGLSPDPESLCKRTGLLLFPSLLISFY